MTSKKRNALLIALGIPIALVIGIAIVYLRFGERDQPRTRPMGVPQTAVWRGGADGGDWLECRPIGNSPANRFFCTIYEDHAGEIVYKGVFRLEGSSATMAQLLDLVGPYTGDEIHLSDGRILVAEVPIDSSTYEEIMARKYEDYVHDQQSRNDHRSEGPR